MAADDLAVRVSLLEKDAINANNALAEMAKTAEKNREAHTQITERLYDRMEEVRSEFKTDIAELKKSFEDKIEAQNQILNQIHSKLNDLDKWRWIVIGAATAIGAIISRIIGLFSINLH